MTSASGFVVRPTAEDDWERLRGLRLEMLRDTPIAFEEPLEAAERRTEAEWRMRAARGDQPAATTLVAAEADGAWVGTMGCYVPPGGTLPWLVAVYVTPRRRGRRHGVADALLDAVEEWAQIRADTLVLEVHESNGRARAFYERHGFHLTGKTRPYPFDTSTRELQMVKRLPRVGAPGV